MLTRPLITGLLVLAGLSLGRREASACWCTRRPLTSSRFDVKRVVFEGTVAAVEHVNGLHIVRFRDVESLFGISGTTVRTIADIGFCGLEFDVGERYVIDASRDATGLFTSACSWTDTADRSGELKRFIRDLKRARRAGP